jgi:hypothetical protein
MSRLKRTFIPFLLLGAVLCLGAADDGSLRFEQLELTDGRTLRDVVVKAYDAGAEKLLLVASGAAVELPIGLIRQPYRDWLKSDAPPGGRASSVVSGPLSPGPTAAPRPAPAANPADADEAAEKVVLDRHKQAAVKRATMFFRYEFKVGSDASRVTALSFETDEPTAVDGWPGRYRTQGTAYVEYFDSKGWTYGRTTHDFEVITEKKPKEALKVVDFSRKS